MKKNVKKAMALLLSSAMALSLAACGGNDGGTNGGNNGGGSADNAASKEGVFAVSELPGLSNFLDEDDYMERMRIVDDTLYMISTDYSDTGYRNLYTSWDMEGNKLNEYVIHEQVFEVVEEGDIDGGVEVMPLVDDLARTETTAEESNPDIISNTYPYNYNILSNGNLVYVEETSSYSQSDPGYYETKSVLKCVSADGTEQFSFDINSLATEEGSSIYLNTIIPSEKDTLFALTYETVYEIDMAGTLVGTYPANTTIDMYSPAFYYEGKPVFMSWNADFTQRSYSVVDLRTGTVEQELETLENIINYNINEGGNSGYDLVLGSSTGIYGYNFGDEEPTVIMNYIASDLPATNIMDLYFISETEFVGTYFDLTNNYKNTTAKFTFVDPSTIPDKEVMVVAMYGLDTAVLSEITEFNKESDTHKIMVNDYSQYATGMDYYAGVSRLNNEIAAGNIPDIVVNSNDVIDISSYASKGLLADFYELMDNDETINKEDYAENVFRAFETDGALYEMVSKFNIHTVIGKTSIFGEEMGLTWDKLDEITAQYPNASVFGDTTTRDSILNYAMLFCFEEFVDLENATCNFDSDEFKRVLEFAAQFPEEIDWNALYEDEGYWERSEAQYIENNALLYVTSFYSLSEMRMEMFRNFLEDTTPVGFPTYSGNGNALRADMSFVIFDKSDNKETAWEFVKRFISEEYQMPEEDQSYTWGIPIYKPAIDEILARTMEKPYWINEDTGEKVEYDNTVYINGQEVVVEPATQEEVDNLKSFIYSVENRVNPASTDLLTIVSEEAAAFFSGQKSVDDVVSIIQSRMRIYISENY